MNEHDTQKREPLTEAECIDIMEIIARRAYEVDSFTQLCKDHELLVPDCVAVALSREHSRIRRLISRMSEHQISITNPLKP